VVVEDEAAAFPLMAEGVVDEIACSSSSSSSQATSSSCVAPSNYVSKFHEQVCAEYAPFSTSLRLVSSASTAERKK